ncbi:MAG: hypothetical protein ABI721_02055 [Candidatus Dojkabacteria bacterium]
MKRNLKASSLVEVLVVLGIISSTILGSMLLVSNSFVVVRQNQTEDYVNGLAVNAMEIVKSPSNVFVSDDTFATNQQTSPVFFKLTKNTNGSYLEKTLDQQITTCDANSQYKISSTTLNAAGAPETQTNTGFTLPDVCVQVKILPIATSVVTNGVQSYFEMTVVAIYNSDNHPVTVTFKSNRYDSFKKI